MAKIFTIATKTSECYGHGSYGKELRICKVGAYGAGDFPLAFFTKGAAQKYLDGMEWNHDKCVVSLKLVTQKVNNV